MLISALAVPALADSYPVSGAWGQSTSLAKGGIVCAGKRVITFNGDQRTDSKGGVRAYRNKSVTRPKRRAIAASTCSPPVRSATPASTTRCARSTTTISR